MQRFRDRHQAWASTSDARNSVLVTFGDVLVELTGNNSQMFEEVMGHLLEVVMDEKTENVFYELLQIDAARLRLILEKKTVQGLVRKCVIRDNGLEWL
jgi:hypothetical protein